MTEIPLASPKDCAQLRELADPLWAALVEHPFPQEMAQGTLSPHLFRNYVTQNLIYLPEYARVLALGLAGSREWSDIQQFSRAVTNIVEVEIPENRALLGRIEELCDSNAQSAGTVAAPATVAYASWLRSIADRFEPALTYAAILPCAWSYGDIGRRWAPEVQPHRVYGEWISFFASDDYEAVVEELRSATDRSLAQASPALRTEAGQVFVTGCRLERSFWDQAYVAGTWPDLL